MRKKQVGITAVIAVLLLIFIFFGAIISFVSDYLWFKEMGYVSVFFTQLFTQLKLGIPTLVIITGLTYLYLNALKRNYYKKVAVTESADVDERTIKKATWMMSAVFGVLATLSTVTKLWFEILQYTNATDFGLADPIFNNDVGFYMFRLQFLTQLNQIGLTIVGAFFLITLLFYLMLMALRRPQIFEPTPDPEYEEDDNVRRFTGNFSQFGAFGSFFESAMGGGQAGRRRSQRQFDSGNFNHLLAIASKQIVVMGVIFFLMVAANFFIKQFSLLYSHTGSLYGAGFTDINVTLLLYRILIGLSVLAAIFFAVGITKRKFKIALAIPVIMILVSVGGTAVSLVVQNVIVSPDEINKESEYLQNNITFTQRAYDLQDISVKDFQAQNTLTKEDILNNMGTFSNIRINDFEPAEQFYNQTQSIRSYYTFHDVDVDRYMIDGEYTQTFLSAREIDETKIGDQWLTQHLKYTHGYGITLSRVDKVTASGQPDMLIDSIPPVSEVKEIQITRPEIYFGEKTNNYIVVKTDEEEFDYPSGENNKYNTYEGEAGIPMSLFNRVVFAIREQSLKLLVSSNINSESRIIINRNVAQRVQKIAPFLDYDEPYIVTEGGKLYWMMDAYTNSPYFPYSEPYSDQSYDNYIRNSVKVVVDAYNGSVDFYLVNHEDPVAETLAKIYPGLFKNFEQMPEGLQAHVRYPNYLFNIQANVYKKYHMNDVKVFYQKEDLWAVANETYGQEEKPMSPNYYITKLPGETEVEFINSIPYTPNGKNNMTGLLVARNDNGNYGELVLYRLPKDRIIYGPQQVEAQINQDTNISKEFSLWNNSGSKYSRGNMFVIPVEESLIYVEPVYLEAANGSLPEVKRVIVAYGDRIAYESTLAQALNKLFGAGAGDPLSSGTPATDAESGTGGTESGGGAALTVEEMARLANEAFENAINAQQKGDWSGYGEYLNELQKYLTLMQPVGVTGVDDVE